ncbi:hypothetical protein A2454_00180 [Candidatus Peribacteria bacterium RIFOXYC2_FULL_55_14]|nr:MAG: hypothetical protein UY87_C0037G0003 [Candidatus Peribacteria bacterium GW2011_GWC2_54_8]OGJ73098.1 MAG: hypothetical protein A2198_02980 [Candidatus Peribacteria bacterium RIFOXYA1_FULL_56_14]OGJ74441.1 MAG: hypothetical protein A2217_00960 [Candidatus Peribacteria bacterium RIFOXYA2_FULL_55_28]OGJ75709.1 MAG: hypothetical protein A2384_05420 [Candidatus Peribacteria bacterium RIFOXYB1_FULL_54_35]OGJ76630.1 MAG: hypothetical protein A2327_02635 [Candidatus Peribacteria bacterium RIFOXY
MSSTNVVTLDSIIDAYVANAVSLQKRCQTCSGTNEDCDICTILRHRPIRDQLESAGIYLKRYEKDEGNDYGYRNSFLTGSYARGTAKRPPKDVDMFWVLDRSKYAAEKEPEPAALLNALAGVASSKTGTSIFGHAIINVEAQHRSIRIDFDDDFSIDIIPAFDASREGKELYEIPDSKLGRYIESNPKVHKENLNSAVSESDLPKLKNITKLARQWRGGAFEEHEKKPKSFHLETAIVEILRSSSLGTYVEMLQHCFDELPAYFNEPRIPDPACPDCPKDQWVDSYLDELSVEQKSLIVERINIAQGALAEAVKLEEQGKIVQAIRKLRGIFQDLPEQEPEALLRKTKESYTPSHATANTGGRTQPWSPRTPMVRE